MGKSPNNMTNNNKKACLLDDRLNFSIEANSRSEPISNTGNFKKGSCHRSYTL